MRTLRFCVGLLASACSGQLEVTSLDAGNAERPIVRADAAPVVRDARPIDIDATSIDAGASADASPRPTDCSERSAPRDGLLIWLDPAGIEANGDAVLRWRDRDRDRSVVAAGGPRVRDDYFGPGLDGVFFDGDDDRLTGAIGIDNRTTLTIALVTSSFGRAPGVEWCCRADETGCSGTYHTALMVDGERDWGGVLLGPSQREVSVRFGNNGKSYSEAPRFYEDHVFGASGYGSCRENPARDPWVAWLRPSSIGTATTITVATLAARRWHLYVDGEHVWERPAPTGGSDGVDAPRDLRIGEGLYGRNWEGVAGAVIVYDRALIGRDLAALHHDLGCTFFGRSVGS